MFNRTGADVAELSGRKQIPAIYNQFFGTAYLGDIPEGFDYGAINKETDAAYYSLYPFVHLAFFWPFNEKFGIYTGLGGGVLIISYKFDGVDPYSENFGAAAFTAGVNLFNMIDVSYTLKTNFKGLIHKAGVGYVYRFK